MASLEKKLDKAAEKDIYLVHLMGISEVDLCEKDKAISYDVNVESVKIAWGLANKYKMRKFVFPSSALVYGTRYELPVAEEFPPFPENTYARFKLEAENYLIANSAGSSIETVILRLANVYGAGMNERNIFNAILKQFKAGSLNLKEYKSVRDYVNADDVINAIIATLNSKCNFKVYNVASSKGISVFDLVKLMASVTHNEAIV